ncbi:MAG: hypothetical protein GC164_02375 [Phycisphaera sp.]|nr:hypothetical protein [Phycisphaera sp.]
MKTRPRSGAFALIMTLVLVMLAAVALTRTAQRSLTDALRTKTALEDLQQRWTRTSLTETLLPKAVSILEAAQDPAKPEAHFTQVRLTCQLNDTDYELIVTDEQAKVNVNRLLSQRSLGAAEADTATLLRDVADPYLGAGSVRLRPVDERTLRELKHAGLSPIGSYGQVFDPSVDVRTLVGERNRPGLADFVTCWGNGKVDVRWAPRRVIEQACERELGPRLVAAVIDARDKKPDGQLADWLATVGSLTEDDDRRAKAMLTDSPGCVGLWVIAHGRQKTDYALTIGLGSVDEKLKQKYESAAKAVGSVQRKTLDPFPPTMKLYRRMEFEW